jgi:hypothetical protein
MLQEFSRIQIKISLRSGSDLLLRFCHACIVSNGSAARWNSDNEQACEGATKKTIHFMS